MKRVWEDVLQSWRQALDSIGVWPEDTPAKIACAGIFALVVCLVAHFRPFTVEAFIAAMLAFGVYLLCVLISLGVGGGLFGIYLHIRQTLHAAAPSEDPEEESDGAER